MIFYAPFFLLCFFTPFFFSLRLFFLNYFFFVFATNASFSCKAESLFIVIIFRLRYSSVHIHGNVAFFFLFALFFARFIIICVLNASSNFCKIVPQKLQVLLWNKTRINLFQFLLDFFFHSVPVYGCVLGTRSFFFNKKRMKSILFSYSLSMSLRDRCKGPFYTWIFPSFFSFATRIIREKQKTKKNRWNIYNEANKNDIFFKRKRRRRREMIKY